MFPESECYSGCRVECRRSGEGPVEKEEEEPGGGGGRFKDYCSVEEVEKE